MRGRGVSLVKSAGQLADVMFRIPNSLQTDNKPNGVLQHAHRNLLNTCWERGAEHRLLEMRVGACRHDFFYLLEELSIQQPIGFVKNQMSDTDEKNEKQIRWPAIGTHLSNSRVPS